MLSGLSTAGDTDRCLPLVIHLDPLHSPSPYGHLNPLFSPRPSNHPRSALGNQPKPIQTLATIFVIFTSPQPRPPTTVAPAHPCMPLAPKFITSRRSRPHSTRAYTNRRFDGLFDLSRSLLLSSLRSAPIGQQVRFRLTHTSYPCDLSSRRTDWTCRTFHTYPHDPYCPSACDCSHYTCPPCTCRDRPSPCPP